MRVKMTALELRAGESFLSYSSVGGTVEPSSNVAVRNCPEFCIDFFVLLPFLWGTLKHEDR